MGIWIVDIDAEGGRPNFDKLLIIRLVLQEDSSNFAKPQDFIEHSGEHSSNFAKPESRACGALTFQAHCTKTCGLASTSCPTDS